MPTIGLAFTMGSAEDPQSVFSGMQQQLSGVATFRATLHRTQSFRNVIREARGSLLFDRTAGTLYQWKSPGRYSFFAADTLLYGIDIARKCGWKKTGAPDGIISRQQIDPLFRLLGMLQIDSSRLTYRGNDSCRLYFSVTSADSTSCTIGLETTTLRCTIIETFDADKRLLGKTVFTYENKSPPPVIPSAIITAELVGSELSMDTVRIDHPQYNKKADRSIFAIPEGITWVKPGTGDPSPQLQLHPASGR